MMLKRISPSQLLEIDARRICLIKPSALGDVVQTLPLLPVLRERFPLARISWVINRELSDLLVGHPHLDEIIPFDRRGTWGDWGRTLRNLRRQKFDLVFDLQGLLRTGVMMAATGAPIRVGLQTAREGVHLVSNCTIPDTGQQVPRHSLYWKVAESLGMGELKRHTLVRVDDADRNWVQQQLSKLQGPVLAVHPGARWITKRWPVEKFAAVANHAMRNHGFSVVIVGAPSELSIAMHLEHLLHRLGPSKSVLNLAGQTTLKQLSGLLEASDVLLTNDSGPMHLGAGLGTPVLGMFTCTSPQRSGPSGNNHELVATDIPCAASYKKQCPHRGNRHMACMDELSTQHACRAFERLMEKNRIAIRAA